MRAFRILFLLMGLVGKTIAQSDSQIESLVDALSEYEANNVQEKIYLHLDKPVYSAGEDIWFKAYTTIGTENSLSAFSKIMYVELIDQKEEPLLNIMLPITMGVSAGNLSLPDTLAEGSYRIRAYTKWMQNFDPIYFYDRTIPITNARSDNTQIISTIISDPSNTKDNEYQLNIQSQNGTAIAATRVNFEIISNGKRVGRGRSQTDEKGVINIPVNRSLTEGYISLDFKSNDGRTVHKYLTIKNRSEEKSLQFFPEGGELLDNTESKLAFKAVGPDGKGIGVKLNIIDDLGREVAYAESDVLGMGSIHISLAADKRYRAKAVYTDGTEGEYELPEVKKDGVSIYVNNYSNEQVVSKVCLVGDARQHKKIVVILQSNGRIYNLSKFSPSKPEFIFRMDKKDLPSGVFQLTLLDENFSPLVERSLFNFNPNYILGINAITDKERYSKREKVDVSVQTHSQDSINVATLSASVINLSKLTADTGLNEQNILTGLLLASDVKGYIENPGSYFKNMESIDLIGLDNLMLTQGWRKLIWEKLDSAAKPQYKAEEGISIKGTIHKLGRKAIESEATVTLLSTHNFMDYIDTLSSEDGSFNFDRLVFPDSVQFLISAKNKKGKNNLDIKIDEPVVPSVGKNKNDPDVLNNINSTYIDYVKNKQKYFQELEKAGLISKSIMIEEVIVNRRVEKKVPTRSSNLNGPGNADGVLTAEDLELCSTLEMCLQGRLVGVMIRNGMAYNTRDLQGEPMQLVVDGMYMEADQLSMINPMDVASIEVLRSGHYLSIYGTHAGSGLLIITSKTGADVRRNYTPKGLITYSPKGYHITKQFYEPKYDSEDNLNQLQQDLRTTIHWQPLLLTDQDGKTNFDFYTSDEEGTYLINIEGMDWNGNLGNKTITIKVN